MTKRSKEEYLGKLKDPRWQKIRLDVLNRDQFRCRDCGEKTKTAKVHHPYHVTGREPWEYPPAVLVTLCEKCHDNERRVDREADGKVKFEEWEFLLGVVAGLNRDAFYSTRDNPDSAFTPDITEDFAIFLSQMSDTSGIPMINVFWMLEEGAYSGYFTAEKLGEIWRSGLRMREAPQEQGTKSAASHLAPL